MLSFHLLHFTHNVFSSILSNLMEFDLFIKFAQRVTTPNGGGRERSTEGESSTLQGGRVRQHRAKEERGQAAPRRRRRISTTSKGEVGKQHQQEEEPPNKKRKKQHHPLVKAAPLKRGRKQHHAKERDGSSNTQKKDKQHNSKEG